ncbi:hypothetical protein CAOG_009364 [Capsaspora owczarzaki ATCC 30864]|uniref:Uncharacterized protein n=1 Tax=Capsaspora owczarzaki (strain ATCC 30864) TaxID=595528 RepID=A0A0D2VHQ6_CAPO3|nr:hypothetical protein CAOG_009364 [Capsaspora owczarzaki ATCC 30864]
MFILNVHGTSLRRLSFARSNEHSSQGCEASLKTPAHQDQTNVRPSFLWSIWGSTSASYSPGKPVETQHKLPLRWAGLRSSSPSAGRQAAEQNPERQLRGVSFK